MNGIKPYILRENRRTLDFESHDRRRGRYRNALYDGSTGNGITKTHFEQIAPVTTIVVLTVAIFSMPVKH